ncbi:AAA-like domain-containing protein [Oscillochloris sp. ZM17-4]|uniref:AAA-like domain-containing protein n=1 Tax=Oscillochloris sp. ZM17-4 TaxID=2866714 RepID=UPI001C738CFC|nr:AAA-like domain-containing protein [Oscillochloris sp. ZM17-4]MBX0331360.1 AAA-like domain-containing protein [Oscillochloris sp. ZM17-4]
MKNAYHLELEIGLYQHRKDTHDVVVRFTDLDPQVEGGPPPEHGLVRFDFEKLRELTLNPIEYGKLLAQNLLADPAIKQIFQETRAVAEHTDRVLRICLFIDSSAAHLHGLRWETLWDDSNDTWLIANQRILFSRYLDNTGWSQYRLRPKADLRALVIIASPAELAEQPRSLEDKRRQLAPIDTTAELQRATDALGLVEHGGLIARQIVSDGKTRITRKLVIKALQEGYDIIYLVCHGALLSLRKTLKDEPYLYFEHDNGSIHVVAGKDLVRQIALSEPSRRPVLIVLASCQSAGSGQDCDHYDGTEQQSDDNGELSALGPRLVKAGIPAVLAMQGNVLMSTVAAFMPEFFKELLRDGQIDRAVAAARSQISQAPDYWTPTLFSRLRRGSIWLEQQVPGGKDFEQSPVNNYDGQTHPQAVAQTRVDDLATSKRSRIFISYKRDVEPDQSVALEVYQALRSEYNVFIDQVMPVGTRWAERIDAELRQADVFISFLSFHSVHSEMVASEIIRAHHFAALQGGRPAILPIRLAYREPFPNPLNVYLDPINWAFWENPTDTGSLITELKAAISGQPLAIASNEMKAQIVELSLSPLIQPPTPSAQPIRLEQPEGTMDPQSVFYVVRPADAIALEAITRQGETISIKAPRQMGKSSLLQRIIDAAWASGKVVAFLDFQEFDKTVLSDPDIFFSQFCAWLTDALELENRIDQYWTSPLGNIKRCTNYVERHLLKQVGKPLVIAMDEVERLFETEFRDDFFGMLRSWHNKRKVGNVWKNLDLVLVTSTEPYQLIASLNQSPFNVGEVIDLADFSYEQVAELNRRHDSPLNSSDESRLMDLLSGHPYLTRRALYLIASNRITCTDLFAHAADDQGPFGDHLRHYLFRLNLRTDLITAMREILRLHICPDEQLFFRLRGAGLVRREGSTVVPRCQLYANYFKERLDD